MLCENKAATKQRMLLGGGVLVLSIFGVTGSAFASDWNDWNDWGDREDREGRGGQFELTDDGYVHACVEKSNKVRLVNRAEDCKRKETYVYWNQSDSRLGVKNVDGVTLNYVINNGRYHIEATKALEGTTVPLDMDIVRELCQDDDGCMVTLSMKDWDPDQPGNVTSRGPAKFFMSQTSNWWRIGPAVNVPEGRGNDGDGVIQDHIIYGWACYLTEREYVHYTRTDDEIGFGLLNWTQYDENMVCMIDIDD